MSRLLLGFTILLLSCSVVVAQQYDFRNYNESDGLEHPFIECVVQDSTGYTWIGTTEGLYLYDGSYFDSFRHSQADSLSISDNHINTIYIDNEKEVLWIGTNFGGVNKFDLKTFTFEHIQREEDEHHKVGIGAIHALLKVKDWLFIGTDDHGLQVYNTVTHEFIDILDEADSNTLDVNAIKYKNGILYLGTNDGVYSYSLDRLLRQEYKFSKAPFCDCDKTVNSLSFINDSTLLICFSDRLMKKNIFSNEKEILYEKSREEAMLTKHLVDERNNLWVGTNGGGLIQLTKDGAYISKHQEKNGKGALANDWISALSYSDKHDILWVGTKDGLSKYSDHYIRFNQFETSHEEDGSLDNIFFLLKDSKQQYWWWTYDGLFKQNEDNRVDKFITTKEGSNQCDTISCGYEEEGQILHLGTFNGLLSIDLNTNQYTRKTFFTEGCNEHYLNVIKDIRAYDGYLWLATYDAVVRYQPHSASYTVYPYPEEYKYQNTIKITTANFDSNGTFWMGDKDGYIMAFNTFDKSFRRYSANLKTEQGGKRYNRIMHLLNHNDSTIFVATYGTGLLTLNKLSGTINQVPDSELLTTNVYSIYKDEEGFLWMNTNSRILRYSFVDKQILSFGKSDGTMCREFNGKAHYQDKDGTILMGGFGGFVEFNPNEFPFNNIAPHVDLGSYSLENDNQIIAGQVYRNWEYIGADTLEIKTDHQPISFYASVLNYENSQKNMSAWQLDGYESNYDTLMGFSYKTYSSLPEGTYTLRVKGCNNDRFWNDVGDSLTIIVKPIFTDSKLFKAFLILLVILVIYAFYIFRIKYLRRKQKLMAAQVQERTIQLLNANAELEESKEEVVARKKELERHRFYLEDLIQERTVDLEKAKMKAEESDRLKTAFLANLSHEIRTPMNSIVGFSTLLSSDVYSADERKEFANVVQKSSDSLLVLINDIIDISRIETGQVNLVQSWINLPALCKDVFKSLELNVNSLTVNYELDIQLPNANFELWTDPERLKQILINLLNNALKFTSEGHVKLKVRLETTTFQNDDENGVTNASRVLFEIEDTGLGIAKEYHNNIFSPFQKVENGHDVHGGIGLGLSIVRQLVEMLGGKIWLHSQLEEGTSFYFYLPCTKKGQA
ncbi:sensor histidine kinase [Carboxylicivirga marina]|uniref:sensor histidine kinase n=1 Tax=Carboxylicivirga marina TaxID=2800988 RepID=UPI00259AA662|nr:hybrid sensor histidine kinase/response regulator [uncultured Carboxylicivirga sp.]